MNEIIILGKISYIDACDELGVLGWSLSQKKKKSPKWHSHKSQLGSNLHTWKLKSGVLTVHQWRHD